MLTLRAAAALLAQADSLSALRPLGRALGFLDTPHPASPEAQHTVGIQELVTSADITRGPGALRLLSATLAPHAGSASTADSRELVRRLCTTLARHAPTRRWCTLTLDHAARVVTLATITPTPGGPRIAVLRVDRNHIVDSDAETLRTLAGVPDHDDLLRHARFTDILKRDALSNRFYHALQNTVTQLAASTSGAATRPEKLELALLCASRCIFLAFLEAKGWLNGNHDFLLHHASATLERGGQLHHRLLRPLFFGTLNTPYKARAKAARTFGDIPFLNGGLFAPTPLERKRHTLQFSDDAIATLIGELLDRYRFTAHEDSTAWSEAAVDPEMLGRAFECLMAPDERRRSGSFYTPPGLVSQVVQDALKSALPALPLDAFTDEHAPLHLDDPTHARLTTLRILDPACGSGAFLVHTLESIARILRRSGDPRPLHTLRRDILTRSIFGVDRNPVAVWLCELRLWLSVVIECPETLASRVPPLPNLDHHIRVGDSLAGGDFRHAPASARTLTALRDRYTRASGQRKHTLATALEKEERRRALGDSTRRLAAVTNERCLLLETLRAKDLFGQRRTPTRLDTKRLFDLRVRSRELARERAALQLGAALPFRFAAHFADVAAAGGFDLLLGNPPWVRPHAIPLAERELLRKEFRTMRDAAWTVGAQRAGASAGFAAQADIAAAFIERATQLLAPGATIAMLVPAKLWRALAGGGTRRFLAEHTQLQTVRDWSEAPPLFDAATYPSLIVARKTAMPPANNGLAPALPKPPVGRRGNANLVDPSIPLENARPNARVIHVAVARGSNTHNFTTPAHQLAFAADPAAPWLLLPHAARTAFERLRRAGPALGDSALGRPILGVKSGCNAAFLVHATEHDDDSASVHSESRTGTVERHLLRPVLRGDGIADHGVPTLRATSTTARNEDLRIIWTHAPDGPPLKALPPATARWLSHWRRQLETRRDARSRTPWWSLFRTDAARPHTARLVWADIGKRIRTRVLAAGDPTVPLNSCYILRTPSTDDAWALSALLSSPVCRAWLNCLAEPARGGFRRYLGWTVASLPLPRHWSAARASLTVVGQRLGTRAAVSADEQIEVAADAYGIPVSALQPLLDWDAP